MIKKAIISLVTIISLMPISTFPNGGDVAAGLFGGLTAGALIGAAASRPRREYVVEKQVVYEPQEVVYEEPADEIAVQTADNEKQALRTKVNELEREIRELKKQRKPMQKMDMNKMHSEMMSDELEK